MCVVLQLPLFTFCINTTKPSQPIHWRRQEIIRDGLAFWDGVRTYTSLPPPPLVLLSYDK